MYQYRCPAATPEIGYSVAVIVPGTAVACRCQSPLLRHDDVVGGAQDIPVPGSCRHTKDRSSRPVEVDLISLVVNPGVYTSAGEVVASVMSPRSVPCRSPAASPCDMCVRFHPLWG